MPLDLPPQVKMHMIVQIAQSQNISVDDYILSAVQEKLAQDKPKPTLEEMYEFIGFRPLPSPPNSQVITDEYINELREQYGI